MFMKLLGWLKKMEAEEIAKDFSLEIIRAAIRIKEND